MDIGKTQTNPSLQLLQSGGAENTEKKHPEMWKTAQEFEGFFLYQVLELMRPPETQGGDELFGGGFAEQMFRHNLNEATSAAITERGGIGLADTIYDQLVKYQESAASLAAMDGPAGGPKR